VVAAPASAPPAPPTPPRLALAPAIATPPPALPAPAPAAPAAAAVASPSPAAAAAAIAVATAANGIHYLQAGLFSDPSNAVNMRDRLNDLGFGNVQLKNDVRNGANVSRVLIGPFVDDQTLAAVRKRLLDLQMPAVPVLE
jgi:cell division protein FtsN